MNFFYLIRIENGCLHYSSKIGYIISEISNYNNIMCVKMNIASLKK